MTTKNNKSFTNFRKSFVESISKQEKFRLRKNTKSYYSRNAYEN